MCTINTQYLYDHVSCMNSLHAIVQLAALWGVSSCVIPALYGVLVNYSGNSLCDNTVLLGTIRKQLPLPPVTFCMLNARIGQ